MAVGLLRSPKLSLRWKVSGAPMTFGSFAVLMGSFTKLIFCILSAVG